jgi:putative ABC transport system permease protein
MNREIFFRMILLRIWRFKAKSVFMALGIVISVMAVIMAQTVGVNLRAKFTDFIGDQYPSNTLLLAAGDGFMGGGQGSDRLMLEDAKAVANAVDGIEKWDPLVYTRSTEVRGGQNSAYVSIMGHSEVAEDARNRSVDDGVFFSSDDIRQARRVALIGKTAARALFGEDSAVGQTVFYNNVTLEIIGELERAGVDPHGRDLDNELHLPYTLLKDKILGRNNISGVMFVVAEERRDEIEAVAEEVVQVMRRQHDLADGARNDFTVIHSGVMLQMVDKAYRTIEIFLPITVSVAFLVSAVLILGIMAAVVKERTREIGLRKALGATPSSLRWTIVAEVLTLCVIGAGIGIAVAVIALKALTPLFASKFGIEHMALSFPSVFVAVALALVAGLLGALLPANRAARMHPVAALA